ncbi:hypothetical protein [Ochrobactrum sp. RH2CCR150]|uniref:hypothetical protein n=1 Tax=Ochrobactrum sp. RH2CCR150 TaxID=2587044 RepID=UPI0015FBE1F0|nr:hypothetical protein [Ochrobactrum sp. RH2CCR150]
MTSRQPLEIGSKIQQLSVGSIRCVERNSMLYVVAVRILESVAISATGGVILTQKCQSSRGSIGVAHKISWIPGSTFHRNLLKYIIIFWQGLKFTTVANHIQGAFMWETS